MNVNYIRSFGTAGTAFLLALSMLASATPNSGNVRKTPSTQFTSLKVGQPFLETRARLLKLGWKPIPRHQNDGYEYSGIEKDLVRRQFVELEGCSVDAGVLCIFYYSNSTKCLRIDTAGEDSARITVIRWIEECPDTEK